jgi:hypothetical protein
MVLVALCNKSWAVLTVVMLGIGDIIKVTVKQFHA